MKKILFVVMAVLFSVGLFAQERIEPSWESIDARPIPEWFSDAKFGIFIHWGPYSVPAWTPKGTYTEWYQYWLQSKSLFGNGNFSGTEVLDFHNERYGEDYSYYKFGEEFKAELEKQYGAVSIDLKTGEYTKIEDESKLKVAE